MTERIAIVGIGCRFPGGVNSPDAFWELLESGRDPIGPIPEGRFDVERFIHPEPGTPGKLVTADGGFLDGIDQFDASFFGLSPREARKIDPQHRLLLEVAYEALEDAGIPVSSLAGRRVGVYAGIWTGEYENVMYRTPAELDFHSITGGGRYAASGRIAYAFDLRGPALTVDTGCSASLVALHLARQAIESGEADLAIVGAANLVLQPHVNIGYSRSGMLSVGGRCRFGDDDAAGYVRSDGAAAVVLKPLHAARANRDPVRGVLLATGVNADGRGSGQLATPSADAQAELLATVYERAGVDPSTVPYVEAHGTGTRAGDPVELSALGRVLGGDRSTPLIVGSVKTNIGHTEACAGMAGLIKTLLALQHRRIPANLHLRTPNATIAWGDLQVEIPIASRPWPDGAPRVAGVSSFGITGTNAHAVVAAADEIVLAADSPDGATARDGSPDSAPHVLTVSGTTPAARDAAAARLRTVLEESPGLSLADVAYTTTARREHHMHRLAVVATDAAEAVAALGAHLAGESSPAVATGEAAGAARVAFVFSGQGSQWVGMTRELFGRAHAFTATLERLDTLVQSLAGWSVLDVLADDSGQRLERVEVIQPTLTCVQIALAEQLQAWGVVPHAVVGHSMGEVAAAYVAGALTMEDAVRVIVTRSRLLARIAGHGAMALLDLDESETNERIAGIADRVSVAAVNGPRSTVISGDPATIDNLLAELDDEGVFCRRVKVDVASHSAQTEPLLADLSAELGVLSPRMPSIPFYSTPRPDAPTDALLDAAYWVDNLRHAVRLNSAVQRMISDGIDAFVEIAPHPVLLSSLADIAADTDADVRTFAGPRRDEPELRRLFDLLARLHVNGASIAWNRLSPGDAQVVTLPHYPWQRERHWIEGWEDWSGTDRTARTSRPLPDRASELVYRIDWTPYEPAKPTEATDGRWVVIGDPAGLGHALVSTMREAGVTAQLVRDDGELNAAGIAGVVDLRPCDATADTPSAFENAMGAVFQQVTGTITTLLNARAAIPHGTWLITRGAQSAGGRHASMSSGPQGVVWGAGRTSGAEHPELRVRLADVDPADSVDTTARTLWKVLSDPASADQVAVAGGMLHRARLTRAPDETLGSTAQWRSDVSYLVTGGLGDLGLMAAEEMVAGGARRIILCGRSDIPPRKQWSQLPSDSSTYHKLERIRALEHQGATVHLGRFDVGDADALETFVREFHAEGWPEIRGVVHCAGAFDAVDISRDAFAAIARGKALGAFNITQALPGLDLLVLFSSSSSVVPQPNLNYAAANAVLDTIADAMRALNMRAVSLSWGAWKGTGMARDPRIERYLKIVENQGNVPLASDTAIALFPRLVAADTPHLIVADVDWTIAAAQSASFVHLPFFSELVTTDAPAASEERRAELIALPAGKRRDVLAERIRSILAEVLQLPESAISPALPFGKQGLDSLMGVEFRNRLERELGMRFPASLAWNYPTVKVLSEHLADVLGEGAAPSATVSAAPAVMEHTPVVALIEELQAQSDEDVMRELRGEVV